MKLLDRRTNRTETPAHGRRGGAGLYLIGALALAGATVALTIDFGQLERDRVADRLDERLERFAELRAAEDAAGLVQLLGEKARAEFNAEHMAGRWAFDDTEVLEMTGPTVVFEWDRGFAQATWQVRVAETAPQVEDEGAGEMAGPTAVPAPTPKAYTLDQSWALQGGTWFLVPGDEPWGKSRAEVLFGDRLAALEERYADYRDLRMADDQVAIYSMLTPKDRERTDLGTFLGIFGTGAMRVHGMELTKSSLDDGGAAGRVDFVLDSELVLAQLPPDMRARLSGTDPAELRRQTEAACTWQFIDGEWYLEQEEPPQRGR
ncbi:hypothetical protein [Planctomycetes bacterium Pla163]